MEMRPMDIEKQSMRIIESELTALLADEVKPIVMRAIHATADFSFAKRLRFSPGVVAYAHELLKCGATIIADTHMVASGVNQRAAGKLGASVVCFMSCPEVADEAASRGVTRALVSMERVLGLLGPKLIVCGNAPTFLLRLVKAHRETQLGELVVIGVPVGFINVVEAKEQVWESGLPAIVSLGRRGGSTVAVAIVNALMYGIEGIR